MSAETYRQPELELSKSQARRFLLAHQGLWPPHATSGKAGMLAYIRRVGCIQFDPLDIVGQNPELVLHSRLADFQPAMLEEMLYQERSLLDGWDKNMSIYPVEDWPYFQRRRQAELEQLGDGAHAAARILPQVRKEIEARGPLSSLDLDFDHIVDWSWGPTRAARAALESMYFWGELIVHHKVHTRKVYDFAHRHIPAELLSAPDPNPSLMQFHDWYVLRRIGGIGLVWNKAGDAWLGMCIKSTQRTATLKRLIDQGRVVQVSVQGVETPLYFREQDRPTLEKALNCAPSKPAASILAPLDNLLWERRLVEALFDFSYRWEVYKPVAERQYGYYVLPILYGEHFVARFEPRRDRQSGDLLVKNWWWEPGVEPSQAMRTALRECFRRFLNYLGAGGLQVDRLASQRAGLDWLIGE